MSNGDDGIHKKYNVTRTDGRDGPGDAHEACAYFVLDLNCDEYALVALKAYARACRKANPALAADIDEILANAPVRCGCREAFCPHARVFSPADESEMAHKLMDDAAEAIKKP